MRGGFARRSGRSTGSSIARRAEAEAPRLAVGRKPRGGATRGACPLVRGEAVSVTGRQTLALARSMALLVEEELQARIAALQTLTLSRSLQAGDFDGLRAQAEALCVALAALTQPAPAPDFVHRAPAMLESTGWIAAHRFLFAGLRCHLLGWPRGLAPDGRRAAFSSAGAPA